MIYAVILSDFFTCNVGVGVSGIGVALFEVGVARATPKVYINLHPCFRASKEFILVLLSLIAFSEPFLSVSDGSVSKTLCYATINCNF